jgi:hypothetical protein
MFKKLYLKLYQVFGFTFLASLSFAAFFYGGLMVFFFFNSTWTAPTVLSSTSDRMMQFASGYQTALQNYETLTVSEAQAETDVEYAHDNVKELRGLAAAFLKYNNHTDRLSTSKGKQLADSYVLLSKLDDIKAQTQQSLKAGLITNEDAVQTITAIQQFHNGTTDSHIALETTQITVQSQALQLGQQLALATNDVKTKEDTLAALNRSLKISTDTVRTLKQSAYYFAMNGHGANLAFVPYDNVKHVKVGSPVYDCYLMIVACHQVATIDRLYKDEQIVDFPLFNVRFTRTVRGVLVDLKVTDQKAMTSQILFIGSKPLFL